MISTMPPVRGFLRRSVASGIGLLLAANVLVGGVPAIASARTKAATARDSASMRACVMTATPRVTDPVATSAAASGVRIPRDEAAHRTPDEWWYFSGHLWGVDGNGRRHCYGYEYVTFQFLGLAPAPVYFGNFAVTDLTRGTFQYGVQQDSYPVPRTRGGFSLHSGPWTMRGHSGHDVLHAALPNYALDLRLSTNRPAAVHGRNGTIPYGPFGTSQYYSWTSLGTGGVIVDHGVPVRVTGLSWMDHQWGAFDFASGAGWDWFSLQLRDGRQYMVYLIRNQAGTIVRGIGTRVGRSGRVTHLARTSFGERTTGHWRSPATGITYGSGWRVKVPGGHLTVTPDVVDQEVDLRQSQGVVYWEGAVSVRGRIHGAAVGGVGYTEINPPAQS